MVYNMSSSTTKPTKWHVLPAKTQISLDIRPVWSEFVVRFIGSEEPNASSGGQRRLWSDWADAQADLSLRGAHVILLVLSCWVSTPHLGSEKYIHAYKLIFDIWPSAFIFSGPASNMQTIGMGIHFRTSLFSGVQFELFMLELYVQLFTSVLLALEPRKSLLFDIKPDIGFKWNLQIHVIRADIKSQMPSRRPPWPSGEGR